MTLRQCKEEREQKLSDLFKNCRLFWAFSNEQFAKNKTPLEEGEKHVSIGSGGYLPNTQAKRFSDGLDEIGKWFNDAIRDNGLRREYIIYELANHEAWYTWDIQDTLTALGPDYTQEEVWAIFCEERENQLV